MPSILIFAHDFKNNFISLSRFWLRCWLELSALRNRNPATISLLLCTVFRQNTSKQQTRFLIALKTLQNLGVLKTRNIRRTRSEMLLTNTIKTFWHSIKINWLIQTIPSTEWINYTTNFTFARAPPNTSVLFEPSTSKASGGPLSTEWSLTASNTPKRLELKSVTSLLEPFAH